MHVAFSTRLGLVLAVFLLALLPLGLGAYVNQTSPPPTAQRLPTRCSRYCESYGCPHATPANSPTYFRLRPLYVGTIKALASGGADWYKFFNIAFYVVLIPALLLGLTYGALRNMLLIRHFKTLHRG